MIDEFGKETFNSTRVSLEQTQKNYADNTILRTILFTLQDRRILK